MKTEKDSKSRMSLIFLAFSLVGMVILTGTVSNSTVFTFNKAYAAPLFDGPDGVAVDSSGNVFVADLGNDRIQKFTNTGKFIRKWGSGCSQSIDVAGASPPDQKITSLTGLASPFG